MLRIWDTSMSVFLSHLRSWVEIVLSFVLCKKFHVRTYIRIYVSFLNEAIALTYTSTYTSISNKYA